MPNDLNQRLGAALKEALRGCRWSREQVADLLTRSLGRTITRGNLDAWVAPSKPEHRIPADALAALCQLLKDCRALAVLAEEAGALLICSEADRAALAYGRNQAAKRRLLREETEIETALDRLEKQS